MTAVARDVPRGEEWWPTDLLACDEGELSCDSPRGPALQDWAWVGQQVDDCFGLAAADFDGAAAREPDPLSAVLAGEGLGDALLPPAFPCAPESPQRPAFKASFSERGCELSPGGKEAASPAPSLQQPGSCKSGASSGMVVDLAADEHSDAVTCHLTPVVRAQRQSSSSKDCSAAEAATFDGVVAAFGTNPELAEHEGDSGSPGLPKEVDLQGKGEPLAGQEGEENSSAAGAATSLQPAGNAPGFIPVSNALLPAASSHSTDAPRAAGGEGADETESTSQAAPARKSAPGALIRGGESPSDSRDSAQSNATATAATEAKPRKLSKLTDAASATDITAVGLASASTGRKRGGRRGSKSSAAADAKSATKRKRATTSKPAAPAVSGQACTQCFTHVTPVWRAGPEGPKTLCNACGVRYMKVAKRK